MSTSKGAEYKIIMCIAVLFFICSFLGFLGLVLILLDIPPFPGKGAFLFFGMLFCCTIGCFLAAHANDPTPVNDWIEDKMNWLKEQKEARQQTKNLTFSSKQYRNSFYFLFISLILTLLICGFIGFFGPWGVGYVWDLYSEHENSTKYDGMGILGIALVAVVVFLLSPFLTNLFIWDKYEEKIEIFKKLTEIGNGALKTFFILLSYASFGIGIYLFTLV